MQGGYGAPAGAPPPPPGQGYNYAAGYNGRRPQAPMNSDPQILSWFNAVDRDGSGNISARELQSALMNGDNTHFVRSAASHFPNKVNAVKAVNE